MPRTLASVRRDSDYVQTPRKKTTHAVAFVHIIRTTLYSLKIPLNHSPESRSSVSSSILWVYSVLCCRRFFLRRAKGVVRAKWPESNQGSQSNQLLLKGGIVIQRRTYVALGSFVAAPLIIALAGSRAFASSKKIKFDMVPPKRL